MFSFFQILFHQNSLEITLYNVCSVHRGMFSTSGGYHEYIGGYYEYIGGILCVHRGGGGGVQYISSGDHDTTPMY